MQYEAIKPKGTFYSDFTISNGCFFAIFEHGSRISKINMGKTELTNETWIKRDLSGKILGFAGEVEETKEKLIIKIF